MGLAFKKIIRPAMVVVGIMLMAYTYFMHQRSLVDQPDSTIAKQIVTHEAHEANVENQSSETEPERTVVEKSPSEVDSKRVKLDLPEYQKLLRWDSERGYMSREDSQVYQSYSEQTLNDLSNAGDIKAMMTLGLYYIEKDNRPDESNAQFYKAAVYGATVALAYLASQAQIDMIAAEADKNPQGREQGVAEIMAYYKVAAMRGDQGQSVASINAYTAVYKARYGQELSLDKKQLDEIDRRAKVIYDDLQKQRHDLGLGDFDNSTPEVLNRRFSSK